MKIYSKLPWGLIFLNLVAVPLAAIAQASPETQRLYLSGHGPEDAVNWDFKCTGGRKSGEWTTIPVPSNWECMGFGEFNYGHDKPKSDEQGFYKHDFTVPANWKGKRIHIVFEGVMTDTEVKINGQSAGPLHQGGFYQFRYDITDKVVPGKTNQLEVNVAKISANSSVEMAERNADYWVFGGIFRPVYLEALPTEFIDWTGVDARADGSFLLDVHLKHVEKADKVVARILDAAGKPVGAVFSSSIAGDKTKTTLQTRISSPSLWSAETPNLYTVELCLMAGNEAVHRITRRFGFRTFEVRSEGDNKGLYLNGKRIMMKGVSRHCFNPETGRAISRAQSYADVRLLKSMNMNALRSTSYPPDVHLLEACDELGLYMMEELGGWQKPCYDTPTAERLIGEMIRRDQMHPCVLFWNNGNEGGWNIEAEPTFKELDLQKRPVMHPWALNDGIDTKHYISYQRLKQYASGNTIFMPTEFLHGLYDGGSGAGLDDYWKVMKSSPVCSGGFLWALQDEGLLRPDKGGILDTDGNHAPDGIIGPHDEKEGSYYTIREIWSPVQIAMDTLPTDFDGSISVANEYDFTNLSSVTFAWELVDYPGPLDEGVDGKVLSSGKITGIACPPKEKATLRIKLPLDWRKADALMLTAHDRDGHEILTWSWPIATPASAASVPAGRGSAKFSRSSGLIVATAGDTRVTFDAETGMLKTLEWNGRRLPIGNGPRLAVEKVNVSPADGQPATVAVVGDKVVITSTRCGGLEKVVWTLEPSGRLMLDYTLPEMKGSPSYAGITFDSEESSITGKRWLGDGPYHVWKNRLKGPTFGIWNNAYNDSTPGKTWEYPEFKGYFADFHWCDFSTDKGHLIIGSETPGLYLRVFTPAFGVDPRNTAPPFPEGDISILHTIPAIGTKFKPARRLGPSGESEAIPAKLGGTVYLMAGGK